MATTKRKPKTVKIEGSIKGPKMMTKAEFDRIKKSGSKKSK